MYIKRIIEQEIVQNLPKGKVIIVYGARRVGKTNLIEHIIENLNEPFIYINGEDIHAIKTIEERSIQKYKELFSSAKILIIDEAQKIDEIGLKLKLMIDNIKGARIIATGSSSFDLNSQTGEPLTGRNYTYKLYPIAQCELSSTENLIETASKLESRLVFGSYPEVVINENPTFSSKYLRDLISSYLLKDILVLDKIRNSNKITDILQLLAFQVGSMVSLNEVSLKTGLDVKTVERYIDLLIKVFIIFKLPSFSRNLRKEISKSSKYYFYDNGIRNAIIDNFKPLNSRNDIGALWENYVISERIKKNNYKNIYCKYFFWRTYDKQEIDLIEERDGELYAYEIKFRSAKIKYPMVFLKNYKDSKFETINKNTYLSFIT